MKAALTTGPKGWPSGRTGDAYGPRAAGGGNILPVRASIT